MRKMTLRSYVDLLRLENRLRDHPFYFRAAKCAIQVYIKLYDEPLKDDSATEEANLENLSPAELKKLRNKQRKAKKKAELENAQAAKAEKKKEQYNKSRAQQNQDGDPEAPILDELVPEKLERTDDPLAKAIEFLKPLQQLTTGIIETHLMTFEIYYRKNKLLIMLQALKRAHAIDPNNPVLHSCIIRFIKSMNKQLGEANEFVKIVIQKEIASELPMLGKKPSQVNEEFLARNRDNPAAIVAAARVIYDEMPEKNKTKAIELLKSCTNMKGLKLETAQEVLSSLRDGCYGDCDAEVEQFLESYRTVFPYATDFKLPSTASDESAVEANDEVSKEAN